MLGNSLAEAEAAEGLVGVLVLVCDAVTLCESGVLAAAGVEGLEVVGVAAFTRAALASLSLLVEVGLGVSFIFSAAVPDGLTGGVVFPGALASG